MLFSFNVYAHSATGKGRTTKKRCTDLFYKRPAKTPTAAKVIPATATDDFVSNNDDAPLLVFTGIEGADVVGAIVVDEVVERATTSLLYYKTFFSFSSIGKVKEEE